MKKIIALALCLIMALSLCTVAFAGSYSSETKGGTTASVEGYYARPLDDNTNKYPIKEFTTEGTEKYTIDGDVYVNSYAAYYALEDGGMKLYVCDESIADCRIFNKSGFVCYALTASSAATYSAWGWVPANDLANATLVKKAAKNECMGYVADTLEYEYYDAQGDKSVTSAAAVKASSLGEAEGFVMVNGVVFGIKGAAVKYDWKTFDTSAVYMHKFSIDDVTFKGTDKDGHMVPVSVKCSECGKTFQIIEKTKLAGYEGKYEQIHSDDKAAVYYSTYAVFEGFASGHNEKATDLAKSYNTYYVLLGVDGKTVTTTTATSDGVESAKTFDAGIAMYVGMSLSAVAGSAVVIGKKKEF